jgi:hypothetical protein
VRVLLATRHVGLNHNNRFSNRRLETINGSNYEFPIYKAFPRYGKINVVGISLGVFKDVFGSSLVSKLITLGQEEVDVGGDLYIRPRL